MLPDQFHLLTDCNTDYSKYYFIHEDEFLVDTKDIVFITCTDEYRYLFQNFRENPRDSNVHHGGKPKEKYDGLGSYNSDQFCNI